MKNGIKVFIGIGTVSTLILSLFIWQYVEVQYSVKETRGRVTSKQWLSCQGVCVKFLDNDTCTWKWDNCPNFQLNFSFPEPSNELNGSSILKPNEWDSYTLDSVIPIYYFKNYPQDPLIKQPVVRAPGLLLGIIIFSIITVGAFAVPCIYAPPKN